MNNPWFLILRNLRKSLMRKVRHILQIPQYKLESKKYEENYTDEVSWLFGIRKIISIRKA